MIFWGEVLDFECAIKGGIGVVYVWRGWLIGGWLKVKCCAALGFECLDVFGLLNVANDFIFDVFGV